MDDCRCSICGCCQYDHKGWNHEWTGKVTELPECDHLLMQVTPLSGLGGLYWRCVGCMQHWSMEETYAAYPQRYVLGADCPGCGCTGHTGFCDFCGCLDNRVPEDLSQEPDDWGYDSNGNVVDLR